VIQKSHDRIGYASLDGANDVAKVQYRHRHAQPRRRAAQAFRRSPSAASISVITTSEIKFSLLIDEAYTELAVRTLHSLYELDK